MEFKKKPIVVRAFHYDLVDGEPEIKQDIQVAMRQVVVNKPDGTEDEGVDGAYFEIMVPFEVSPNPGFFSVSGQISQLVQTMGYFGSAQDLPGNEIEMLSRPLVEYIETLTYQVTSVALNEGVNLNFVANPDENQK